MKINVLIQIEDGNSQIVEVKAGGKDIANIFITADTLQNARVLFSQAKESALEAMKNWKPEEDRADRPADPVSEEATPYEETPAGRRFIKQIENAKKFYHNKHNLHRQSGLRSNEIIYLADKYHNNLINGSFDLTALAFRQGYTLGQQDAKSKK